MRKFSFLIIALGILVYVPSLFAPFQFDDYLTIVVNPFVKNLARLDLLWAYDPSRFLTHLTFAINFHFGALNSFGYHIVNLVIHVINTFLVFALARRIFRTQGVDDAVSELMVLSAALFFMLHPVQTSAVTYVAQRSTLLTVLFYLSTILTFWNFRVEGKGVWLGLSFVLTLLGSFCKPIMISVPFVLFLIDFYFIDKEPRKRWFCVGHLAIVMIIPVLLAYWRYQDVTWAGVMSMTKEADVLTRPQYLFTQFHVLWEYIRLIILPVEQNLDYDFPIYATFWNTRTVAAFLGLVSLFGLGVALYKRQRLVSFGILWFFLTLALESSVFPIKDVIFEHRLYLPLVGIAIVIAYGIFRIKDIQLSKGIAVGLLVIFGGLGLYRNYIWSDRILFLEDAAAKSPKKLRVLNSLAIAYAESGRYSKAIEKMKYILQLNPSDKQTINNLANTYRLMGDFERGLFYYNRSIEYNPVNGAAYYFRSMCHFRLHNYKDALKDVSKAQELNFPHIDAYYLKALHNAQ